MGTHPIVRDFGVFVPSSFQQEKQQGAEAKMPSECIREAEKIVTVFPTLSNEYCSYLRFTKRSMAEAIEGEKGRRLPGCVLMELFFSSTAVEWTGGYHGRQKFQMPPFLYLRFLVDEIQDNLGTVALRTTLAIALRTTAVQDALQLFSFLFTKVVIAGVGRRTKDRAKKKKKGEAF